MIGNSQDPQSSQLGLQLEECLETQDQQSSQLGLQLEECLETQDPQSSQLGFAAGGLLHQEKAVSDGSAAMGGEDMRFSCV
jgi:hypothetical protein